MGDSFIPGLSVAQAAVVIVVSLVFAGMVSGTKIGKRFIIPSLIAVAIALVIYDAAKVHMPVSSPSETDRNCSFFGSGSQ